MIGGNLIGGWAHSRDLMYASKLFTTYNTEAKIFETLELAQECGINTIQVDPKCVGAIVKYNQQHTPKIQTMICISLFADKTRMNEEIKRQVDLGATLLYSHGGVTDGHMMNGGGIDVIGQMVDLIKAQGVPAGVGGHSLNMPIACEKNNLNPDFYVKTFHMRPVLVGDAQGAAEGIRLDGARIRPTTMQTMTICGAIIPRRRRPSWKRSTSLGWHSR